MFSVRSPWLFACFWLVLGAFSLYIQIDNPLS
jgi:hypothetical protein